MGATGRKAELAKRKKRVAASMALDAGNVVEGLVAPKSAIPLDGRTPPPTLRSPGRVGQILRDVRLYKELELEHLAQSTRVRPSYLAAIENNRLDQLPSRPFAMGYVRAYAAALGLDGDLAAARFKVEAPDAEPLRAPLGVERKTDPRLKIFGIAGALALGAIVSWNIVQHAFAKPETARHGGPEVAASSKPNAPQVSGPLSLGAPLPAPSESTVPQPYYTPGIEEQMGGSSAAVAAQSAAAQAAPVGSPFVKKGAVYGADPHQSNVVLQARKGASLVVHGAGGSVYFARQLAPGEAYRAPQIGGLTIDVSEPEKFDVYVGGALKGPLKGPRTAITQLGG